MKSTLTYLNGNGGKSLLALGETNRLVIDQAAESSRIQSFMDQHQGKFIFFGLSYDLKASTLDVASQNPDYTGLPLAFLWTPELVVEISNDQVASVLQGDLNSTYTAEISRFFASRNNTLHWNANMRARTNKESYLKDVAALQREIQYGNIYEVNYCQEFYDDKFELNDPRAAYFRMNEITNAPFSAYLQFDEFHVMCGSPERFIQKQGQRLSSQPIKGTRKRSTNPTEDQRLKEDLLSDPKERAENVMIVDLVRNDLSRVAQKSSVHVDELFGVYSFNTVHQLISTISCNVKENVNFIDILNATFPMGSMTGAPKLSAVNLIEKYENFRRGWYSGSIGYIAPNGDFDLNVVIRSLIYNTQRNYLSCAVGGAITIQSNPEDEYEECNTKVKTILDRMHHG